MCSHHSDRVTTRERNSDLRIVVDCVVQGAKRRRKWWRNASAPGESSSQPTKRQCVETEQMEESQPSTSQAGVKTEAPPTEAELASSSQPSVTSPAMLPLCDASTRTHVDLHLLPTHPSTSSRTTTRLSWEQASSIQWHCMWCINKQLKINIRKCNFMGTDNELNQKCKHWFEIWYFGSTFLKIREE